MFTVYTYHVLSLHYVLCLLYLVAEAFGETWLRGRSLFLLFVGTVMAYVFSSVEGKE